MKPVALLLILLIASSAAAIEPLKDKRPANVSADAEVVEASEVMAMPQNVPTKAVNMAFERIVPASAKVGEYFDVTLRLTNNDGEEYEVIVVDQKRPGLEYDGAPEPYVANYEALKVELLRWRDRIGDGQTREYSYRVRATKPMTATFAVATADDTYGNTFESKPAYTAISCEPDGKCGPGENHALCPSDCETGIKDDSCDGVQDGMIDPDCAQGADPDPPSMPSTTLKPKTTLPQTKPLDRENETGCLPFMLAPLALLTSLTAKALRMP
ncbi:MAG: hypothetical protein V1875_03760 [Candidatus Altiarchaeota archaeon]